VARDFLIRIGMCIFIFGFCLYSYIHRQNELTSLRIKIPEMEKRIRVILEESRQLEYQVDQFENPAHLMELARHPEFSHLQHPLLKDILLVPEGIALEVEKKSIPSYLFSGSIAMPVGAVGTTHE